MHIPATRVGLALRAALTLIVIAGFVFAFVSASAARAQPADPAATVGPLPDFDVFEPVAVPEPSAEALRYYREGRWLWVIGQLWGLALPALVLASGFSARLRDASQAVANRLVPCPGTGPDVSLSKVRRAVRWLILTALYGVLLLVLMAVASLPLAYFGGFVRSHAYGLSNQSLGRWLNVWAVNLGVSLALSIPALWAVYALIHRSPRHWWLVVGLLTVPVGLGTAMLKPVWIDPLTNDYGPMRDRALEARILALADRAGVDGSRVYEVDKSRDTKAVNAYVTGFLGTKRIVLWDTLTAKLDDDQVLAVMAHEIGHYVLGHVVKGLLVSSSLTILGLYLVHRLARWSLRRYGERLRVERLADVASLPMILLLARFVALGLFPVGYAYSRHIEHQADLFAIELTRDNRAAATAFVTLQRENLSHPRPGWLDVVLRSTHPSLGARIDFCNSYRPWEEGLPLRYGHLFRDQPVLVEGIPEEPIAGDPGNPDPDGF